MKSPTGPSSAEKAARTAAAQIDARIRIIWPKDKKFYTGTIIVSVAGVGLGWLVGLCAWGFGRCEA